MFAEEQHSPLVGGELCQRFCVAHTASRIAILPLDELRDSAGAIAYDSRWNALGACCDLTVDYEYAMVPALGELLDYDPAQSHWPPRTNRRKEVSK